MTHVNLDLSKISDTPIKEFSEQVLGAFCQQKGFSFLLVREVLNAGKSGCYVYSVEYGNKHTGTGSVENYYRVVKVGPIAKLKDELEGAQVFTKLTSNFFCRIEGLIDDVTVDWEFEGEKATFSILIYEDVHITSSAYSLKTISKHVIDYYKDSQNIDYNPEPIGEKIGFLLNRIFDELKGKVYNTKKVSGEKETEPFRTVLQYKIDTAFDEKTAVEFNLDQEYGISREALISRVLHCHTHYIGTNIHGDLNPNNVLLCLGIDGREIEAASIIDYGEVREKKQEGLTAVFWDLARLSGEILLDALEENGALKEKENALSLFRFLFLHEKDNEYTGIFSYLLSILIWIYKGFFTQKPLPGTETPTAHTLFTQDEAIHSFLSMLQTFFLFYTKFTNEGREKRELALYLAVNLEDIKNQSVYLSFAQTAEERYDAILTRFHSAEHYYTLRKERFAHLETIIPEILPGFQEDRKLPRSVHEESYGEGNIYTILQRMKAAGERKILLLGEGGQGKTTGLLYLLQRLSESSGPIPFYLELSEINLTTNPEENWIMTELLKRYGGKGAVTKEDIGSLEGLFREKEAYPHYVLLLDGLNEVVRNHDFLYRNIRKLSELPNLMIIVTSRFHYRNATVFNTFKWLELSRLDRQTVDTFLERYNKQSPDNEALHTLLSNPMYLCLYTGIENAITAGEWGEKYFPDIETPGELFHNFILSTIWRWNSRHTEGWKQTELTLLLEHILPTMAYHMEKEGLFRISRDRMYGLISRVLETIDIDFCIQNNIDPEKVQVWRENTGGNLKSQCYYLLDRPENAVLTRELHLLEATDHGGYSWIHQNFRDYFTAVYVNDQIQQAIMNGASNIEALEDRVFPPWLVRMMGELAQEHKRAPVIHGGYKPGPVQETLFDKVLDMYRGQDIPDGNRGLQNIIAVMKEVRKDLSDSDLSELDLRRIVLNGVRIGRGDIKGVNVGANMKGVKARKNTFFPQGHTGSVNSSVYSPDGHYILSASDDGTIKEWDRNTGVCMRTFDADTFWVDSANYSPDGSLILSASFDGKIKEWDYVTGACINSFEGHSGYVKSAIYSVYSSCILFISGDNTIKEWDRTTRACISTYEGHSKQVNSAVYSADGSRILSASSDGTIKEWDCNTGKCIRTIEVDTLVYSAAYSPDGSLILSASADGTMLAYGTIREWDCNTGICIRTIEMDTSVYSATYSPDASYILTVLRDGAIKEWDCNTGICIRTIEMDTSVNLATYSPDGSHILTVLRDGAIKEWDRITRACIRTYEGHSFSSRFEFSTIHSACGSYIISIYGNNMIKEWDQSTGKCIRTFEDQVYSANYSPDGSYILTVLMDGVIKEWDQSTGMCIKTFPVKAISAIYSPDGSCILAVSGNNTIQELNSTTGACLNLFEGHSKQVKSVIYSPNASCILSASVDGLIKEWDRSTGNCIKTFECHSHGLNYATYSFDGSCILSVSDDKMIEEWNRNTGTCLRTYENQSKRSGSAIYSPDGSYILTAAKDNVIKERDLTTGVCVQTFKDHDRGLDGVVYSPDGSCILVTSNDDTIKEWDRITGACIRTYKGHSKRVNSVIYSTDGFYILSVSNDGTIKEWDRTTGACLRTFKDLNRGFGSENVSPFFSCVLSTSMNSTIDSLDKINHERIQEIENIPSLFIQGIDLRFAALDMYDKEVQLLEQHGALLDAYAGKENG